MPYVVCVRAIEPGQAGIKTMTRYIAIDNCTGYVWGDSADLNGRIWNGDNADGSHDSGPIGFCRALDTSLGETGREYTAVSRHGLGANQTGYHIYRADVGGSDAVMPITNGQDEEMIAAVQRDCEYVTTIRCVEAE